LWTLPAIVLLAARMNGRAGELFVEDLRRYVSGGGCSMSSTSARDIELRTC